MVCEPKNACPRHRAGEGDHEATHVVSWRSPTMPGPAFEAVCDAALRPVLNGMQRGTRYKLVEVGQSFAEAQEVRV